MMMEYEYLEEAGILSILFNGKPLDAYSLGILQLNLQEIIDKVAYSNLEKEGVLRRRPPRYRGRKVFSPYSGIRIIRAEIKSINVGSLYQDICFLIPAVIADPNVRAVLQGLAANIIFAIGASKIRGLIYRDESGEKTRRYPPDPDVGENVRDIAVAMAENGGGEISFESKTPRGGRKVVTIKVNSNH